PESLVQVPAGAVEVLPEPPSGALTYGQLEGLSAREALATLGADDRRRWYEVQRRIRARLLECSFSPPTDTLVGLYQAHVAGLDAAEGAYVAVCEHHGTSCGFTSKRAARAHLPYVDWCEPCMAAQRGAVPPSSGAL